MSDRPQITSYYADGTPSEVRDMTDEEIASLPLTPEDGASDLAD